MQHAISSAHKIKGHILWAYSKKYINLYKCCVPYVFDITIESSDVIFSAFSNLSVNGKLSVNCHNLSVNYQEFLKRAADNVN